MAHTMIAKNVKHEDENMFLYISSDGTDIGKLKYCRGQSIRECTFVGVYNKGI